MDFNGNSYEAGIAKSRLQLIGGDTVVRKMKV